MTSINNKTITSVYEKMKAYERISKKLFILLFMLVFYGYSSIIAQPSIPAGQVDIFVGADFNYRDLFHNGKIYEILLNLTPGVKWNMGKGWQAAAQALVPVYNDYGDRYKKVRLNMAVLSKEAHWRSRWFLKASGGLFGRERYGLDFERDVCRKPLVGIGSAGWINRLLFNGSGLGSKYPQTDYRLAGHRCLSEQMEYAVPRKGRTFPL